MSKPYTLIGLTGPAASGKDTVADLLVTHCGFVKLAFADPLKAEVSDAFGIEPWHLTQRETKEHPMTSLALRKCRADGFVGRIIIDHQAKGDTLDLDAPRSPRQIMQWWGTDYRRHQSETYWIDLTRQRISHLIVQRLASRIVIADCRFPDEIRFVRRVMGGEIWQVRRDGIDIAAGAHVSETTGAEFAPNAVLNNSWDIEQLQEQVIDRWVSCKLAQGASV